MSEALAHQREQYAKSKRDMEIHATKRELHNAIDEAKRSVQMFGDRVRWNDDLDADLERVDAAIDELKRVADRLRTQQLANALPTSTDALTSTTVQHTRFAFQPGPGPSVLAIRKRRG